MKINKINKNKGETFYVKIILNDHSHKSFKIADMNCTNNAF